jgi:hypothetical protein
MLNRHDYILDRRKVPIVGGEAASQLPYSLNRVEIRAIRRKIFEPKPRLRCLPPLLMQRRVMISRIIRDHDDSPAGTGTDLPEMPKEMKACLGIKASCLTPVHQFAVSQADSAKVADTLSRRMMQQNRVFGLRRNPHPTSGTVLLEVNLIHRPEIHVFASCQPAKFFLPGPDPQDWHWRSEVSASASETRVAGTPVGIVGCPGSHPTRVSRTPKGSCRPTNSRPVQNRWAAAAMPRLYLVSAPRSAVAADRIVLPQSDRLVHRVRIVAPSKQPFAVHRQVIPIPGGSSFPELPKERRAGGDHIEILQTAGSRPAVRKLRFLHPLSLVASCHQDIIKRIYEQLLMTLCIMLLYIHCLYL